MELPRLLRNHAHDRRVEEEREEMCRLIEDSTPVQRTGEHDRLDGDGLEARVSRALD